MFKSVVEIKKIHIFAARIWRNEGLTEGLEKLKAEVEQDFLKIFSKSLASNKKASIFALPLANELVKRDKDLRCYWVNILGQKKFFEVLRL